MRRDLAMRECSITPASDSSNFFQRKHTPILHIKNVYIGMYSNHYSAKQYLRFVVEVVKHYVVSTLLVEAVW